MQKILDIKQRLMPRSKTALLQHLQNLVVRGNRLWIGGEIPFDRIAALEPLIKKLDARYRTHRDERGRIYDRSKGRASCHLVLDIGLNGVRWWVLSSSGNGGLADPNSHDFRQVKDAMSKDGHITVGPYVLRYTHKKDARTLVDARSGKSKTIYKNVSTFTWSMTMEAVSKLRLELKAEVSSGRLGEEPGTGNAPGLRRFLALQRRRPLFSGVRTQVLELHKEAMTLWESHGKGRKTDLLSVDKLTHAHLPKMRRLPIYRQGWTVRSVIEDAKCRAKMDSGFTSIPGH